MVRSTKRSTNKRQRKQLEEKRKRERREKCENTFKITKAHAELIVRRCPYTYILTTILK